MTEQSKQPPATAESAEVAVKGGVQSDWVMQRFEENFGHTFKSAEDLKRFKAGVAAELLRNKDLREGIKKNPMVRYGLMVALATCAWDRRIPSVHTYLNLRWAKNAPVVTREDKLEASLADLDDFGFVPQRPVLVYEGDEFSTERQIVNGVHTNRLTHKPCGIDDPEKITGGYIILERKDGSRTDWEYVPREVFNVKRQNAIGHLDDKSRRHAPWHKHFGEMSQKTVAKRATRYFNKVPLVEVIDAGVNEAAERVIASESLTETQRAVLREQYDRKAYAEDDGELPPEVRDLPPVSSQADVIEAEAEPVAEEPKKKAAAKPKKKAEPEPEPQPATPVADDEDDGAPLALD